jgi:hypothetical protein
MGLWVQKESSKNDANGQSLSMLRGANIQSSGFRIHFDQVAIMARSGARGGRVREKYP